MGSGVGCELEAFMSEEFDVWYFGMFPLEREMINAGSASSARNRDQYLRCWQASRESPQRHPLIQALHNNGDLIAAQATIAQQAQMIEHLRGGPTPGFTAVDMTTAAADGFRDGAASRDAEVEGLREDLEHAKRQPLYSTSRMGTGLTHRLTQP
jgi:hypothetical protein